MEVYQGGYRSVCYHAERNCVRIPNYAIVVYRSAGEAEAKGLHPCRSCTVPRLKCIATRCSAHHAGVCLRHYWQGEPQAIPITGCIEFSERC